MPFLQLYLLFKLPRGRQRPGKSLRPLLRDQLWLGPLRCIQNSASGGERHVLFYHENYWADSPWTYTVPLLPGILLSNYGSICPAGSRVNHMQEDRYGHRRNSPGLNDDSTIYRCHNSLRNLLHHFRVVRDVRLRGRLWVLWSTNGCPVRLRRKSLTVTIHWAAWNTEKIASLKEQTESHDED